MTDPQVTVVVPSRDRPEALAACLAALADQTLPDVEVVVVDDASRDRAAVAAVAAEAGVRLVRADGRGPAAARNRGAADASSPLLAFTDDDCRPDPGWLAALVQRLDGGAAVVAGPTRNAQPGDPLAAASQAVTNHLVDSTLDAGTVAFAPTSNLAMRAEVHRDLPFDETFPLAAGEDRDWCARVVASGRRIEFEPTAVVDHHQDLTLARFWRQHQRYGAARTGTVAASSPRASTRAWCAAASPRASGPARWSWSPRPPRPRASPRRRSPPAARARRGGGGGRRPCRPGRRRRGRRRWRRCPPASAAA